MALGDERTAKSQRRKMNVIEKQIMLNTFVAVVLIFISPKRSQAK